MVTPFSILPENLKIELKKGFFVKNFNAREFNKLFSCWNNERAFCEQTTNGELSALYRYCIRQNAQGVSCNWTGEQLQQMLGFFNIIVKIQENNVRKLEIEAMCEGKVTFEQLKNEFPKWEFRPYYKDFGYHSVLCGYNVVLKDSKNNYGVYIKKADFYSPDEVREKLKKYIADQKVSLENYYKTQMAKLDNIFND